ncbi:MAG: hypothetical protein ACTSR8_21660 [Promethearchaeota archaeon]
MMINSDKILAKLRDIQISRSILYTSRPKRENEIDGIQYYFRSFKEIKDFNPDRFIIFPVRSDLQAIDTWEIRKEFEKTNILIIETFHTIINEINKWKKNNKLDFIIKSVFLLPLSFDELKEISCNFKKPEDIILYNIMKEKLQRRNTEKQEKIEERALSAYEEIQAAKNYDYRIICHHGEDDINAWKNLYPEVVLVLQQFLSILFENRKKNSLILLSGPSCVGKGPLLKLFWSVLKSPESQL